MIVDTETTGLNVTTDEVREFAACVLDRRCERIQASYEWDAGEGVEELRSIVERIGRVLSSGILIAHNLEFDLAFLRRHEAVQGTAVAEPARWLCTMRAAGGYVSLDTLADAFGVVLTGRHTAVGDARGLAEIVLRLSASARELGAGSISSIQELATARCGVGGGGSVGSPEPWTEIAQGLPRIAPVAFPSPEQRAVVAAIDDGLRSASERQPSLVEATRALQSARISAIGLEIILSDFRGDPADT